MTPERHSQIQRIFEAAVDLSGARRDSYLDQACAGGADLRARIGKLLAADEQETETVAAVKVCAICSRCYDSAAAECDTDGGVLEFAFPGALLIDGKYRIERRLGHGGMGAVYLVCHTGLEKRFALKLILSGATVIGWYRKSFEIEARALGRLKHPHIVGVTDYGIDPRSGGVPYLVMEYLEGETLRQVLRKRHYLPLSEALPLLRSIGDAIDFAHDQGIIHGDLKPANLFLVRAETAESTVKVVDFGLARLPGAAGDSGRGRGGGISSDAAVTVTAAGARGTPPYMAPELFRCEAASQSSDRFAFGAVAYEILSGELPFGRGGCRSARDAHDYVPPDAASSHNAALPREIDAPLIALLDPLPARRPSSASAAVAALEAAWLAARQREWRQKETPRRLVFALAAAILVVLIAGLASRLPIARALEEKTVDARFSLTRTRPPDPRIVVVGLDDASLAEDRRPLGEWSSQTAALLERLFASGASAVAVDILLPESWSQSPAFSSAVLRHADRLALALESKGGQVIGYDCVASLTAYQLGPERYSNLFGFVNLEEDQDRILRRARAMYPDRNGRRRDSLAARAVAAASLAPPLSSDAPFWIDYSVHPQDIARVSWKDVNKTEATIFRDRIVFIGDTSTSSNDELPLPSSVSAAKIPGVVLEAEIANTIVNGYPIRDPGLPACLIAMGAAGCFAIALALRYPHRSWIALILVGGVACGYLLMALVLCRSLKSMIAVIAPEFAILLAAGAAWTLKSRLSPYPEDRI